MNDGRYTFRILDWPDRIYVEDSKYAERIAASTSFEDWPYDERQSDYLVDLGEGLCDCPDFRCNVAPNLNPDDPTKRSTCIHLLLAQDYVRDLAEKPRQLPLKLNENPAITPKDIPL